MQAAPLKNLRADGERRAWQAKYVRNALACLKHIDTKDRKLGEHLLDAEQALRLADAYLKSLAPV